MDDKLAKPTRNAIAGIFKKNRSETALKIIEMTSGSDHYVYNVITNRGEYAIRFPKKPSYVSRLKIHAWANRKWIAKGAKVPKPILVTSSFLIETFIRGKSLWDAPTTKIQRKKALEKFGKMLRKMHTAMCQKFGRLTARYEGENAAWKEFLEKRIRATIHLFKKEKILPKKEIVGFEKWLKKFNGYTGKAFLLHGDIHNNHILIENGKFSGLIDSSDALSGDPMYDLGYYYAICKNKKDFDAILKGYKKVRMKDIWFYAGLILARKIAMTQKKRKKRIPRLRKIIREQALLS